MAKYPHHPKWASKFLQWYCKESLFEEISGDIEEAFLDKYEKAGLQKARWFYRYQVLKFFRPFAIKSMNMEGWLFSKLTANYLKMAIRQMKKHKLTSALNILGLSIGLTCFSLLFLFEQHELSYDNFHTNKDYIFRILRGDSQQPIATTAFGLAPRMEAAYPDLTFVRFFKDRSRTLVKLNEQQFYESGMFWADKNMLEMFSFPLMSGDPKTALSQPLSVVITPEIAVKYFGRTDVLGKHITVNWNDKDYPFKITGVLEEIPTNSHLQFDFLLSFISGEQLFPGGIPMDWTMTYVNTFIQLPPGVTSQKLESEFSTFVQKHVGEDFVPSYADYLGGLQPLSEVHFQTEVVGDFWLQGEKSYGYIALGIGLFVLLIACINYINLVSARAIDRAKEVGLRKVVGARRNQLMIQFLFESATICFISLFIALGLCYMLLPLFNQLMGTALTTSTFFPLMLPLGSICLFTGLISGSYPALVLSRFNPVQNLKALNVKQTFSGEMLRKGLVMFQFTIASLLIVATIVIVKQLQYINHKNLGYEKEQVLIIPHGRKIRADINTYKQRWLQVPGVEKITVASKMPSETLGNRIEVWKEENSSTKSEDAYRISAISVDHDFLNLYGIQLLEGRDFSREMGMDSKQSFIINQQAAELLGWGDPIGKNIHVRFRTGAASNPIEERTGQIIGLMEDVHFESMHSEVEPVILFFKPYWYYYISVKVNTEELSQTIAQLENAWLEFFPDRPLEYFFLDDRFDQLYRREESSSKAIMIFSVIAILISCMGLFGLATFIVFKKNKEFSIRKILGATSPQLIGLLSRDFLLLVLGANFIAFPIAIWLMQKWLSAFAYRIELQGWMFVVAGLISFFIAMISMALQAYKVAINHPAEALRTE